jgi:hypothetical protein
MLHGVLRVPVRTIGIPPRTDTHPTAIRAPRIATRGAAAGTVRPDTAGSVRSMI